MRRVVVPQAETVREIYDVRWVIEAEAVRRLVRDADADDALAIMARACGEAEEALHQQNLTELARANGVFHATLVNAVRNGRLIAQYRAVHNLITLYRHQSLNSESWAGDSTREHRPLLECLARRDEDGALALLRTHVERARDVVLRRIESEARKAKAA